MGGRGGTAFERIGGVSAVVAVVERLYERVARDPDLAPYFHTTNMPVQRDKLAGMVAEALGGPRSPWLTGLVEAHHGLEVTDEHYTRMSAHLMGVLEELEVASGEQHLVAQWLAAGRWAVVGGPDR